MATTMIPVAYAVRIEEPREDAPTAIRIELWNVTRRTTVQHGYMFDAQGRCARIVGQFGETEDGRLIELPM